MAKIIPTGEIEAIDLKRLRSKDILYLDDEIDTTVAGLSSGVLAKIVNQTLRTFKAVTKKS